MSADLQARVEALEALLERYVIKGERPMVCKFCETIFQWLTPHEQGFAVHRHRVCQSAECRDKFHEERRIAIEQRQKWAEEDKERRARVTLAAAGLKPNGDRRRR